MRFRRRGESYPVSTAASGPHPENGIRVDRAAGCNGGAGVVALFDLTPPRWGINHCDLHYQYIRHNRTLDAELPIALVVLVITGWF